MLNYLYIYEDQFQEKEPPSEEQVEFEDIEKFIIYQKIREFLYELLSSDLEGEEYHKVVMLLNILLTFFETFTYNQLVILLTQVVDQVAKLKLVNQNGNGKKDSAVLQNSKE